MFGFNKKCEHPFSALGVYRGATTEPSTGSDKHGVPFAEDYNTVKVHLFCNKCGAGDLEKHGTEGALVIKYADTIGGHEAAMQRMRDRALDKVRNAAAARILAREIK